MPIIHVTQEHIDQAPAPGRGGKNPVTLALQEQLGPTWLWLGGNQVRDRRSIGHLLSDLGIIRIPPLVDGRYLHNAMSKWFYGQLEPFSFEVPLESDPMPYGIKHEFTVEMARRLPVEPVGPLNLVFLEQGTATFGVLVTNNADPPEQIDLEITVMAVGTHQDKIIVSAPSTLSIPAGAQVQLNITVELVADIPIGETAGVKIIGKEA
jgi:hypothetical protein